MTLDVKSVKRWRREVWRAFQSAGFSPAEINAATVLAGAAIVGTDCEVLSELTGLSTEYVLKVIRRLRKHRVISGNKIRAAWGSDEAGNIAVVLDAGTAAGLWKRCPDPKRSAAQKARPQETRARGPRGPRKSAHAGPLTLQKADPLYGLNEWE